VCKILWDNWKIPIYGLIESRQYDRKFELPEKYDGKLHYRISTNLWIDLWNTWESQFMAFRKNHVLLQIYMTENWSCKTKFGGSLLIELYQICKMISGI
jgi:hypothetical protein